MEKIMTPIFIVKIICVLLLLGVGTTVLPVLSKQVNTVSAADHSDDMEISERISYQSIFIKADDTLWGIATRYQGDHCGSVKEYVSEIKRCNNMTSDAIYAGSYLVVPIHE